jgi:prepilin-type N-terminal cleavage/methylation domain-containing protein
MKNTKRQFGFSLIELMIGMVIGLLVSGIVIATFTQSKNSYNQDEEIAQLQENGRYTLQLLTRELSMAGFAGTAYTINRAGFTSPTNDPCSVGPWPDILVNEPIIYQTSVPTCISDVKDKTNILTIKRVAASPKLTQLAGKLYLKTSSEGVSLASAGDTCSVNAETGLPVCEFWEILARIYYIKDVGDIPTLRRAQLTSSLDWDDDVELVRGIENFQVTFGVDSDQNKAVDAYITNDEDDNNTTLLGAETQAIMAKIDILVRSINKDHNYTNLKSYHAGSTTKKITNNLFQSKYYGRVFSTTVPMRNISYRNVP